MWSCSLTQGIRILQVLWPAALLPAQVRLLNYKIHFRSQFFIGVSNMDGVWQVTVESVMIVVVMSHKPILNLIQTF
jgi:hypothetical protein